MSASAGPVAEAGASSGTHSPSPAASAPGHPGRCGPERPSAGPAPSPFASFASGLAARIARGGRAAACLLGLAVTLAAGAAEAQTDDTAAPAFASASVTGARVEVIFDEQLELAVAPATSAFTVTATPAGGTPRTVPVSRVRIIQGDLFMALANPVLHGETVRLTYTKPAARPLSDAAGNEVASFTDRAVANSSPPGSSLEYVGEGCTEAACPDAPTGAARPGPGNKQVTVDWTPATTGGSVTEWQVKAKTGGVSDTTRGIAAATRTHTFSDLDPTKLYEIVVQGIGNDGTNDKFGDASVAGNVRPLDTAEPVVSSASVNRTALTVTFSKALNIRSRPAGSAFTATVTAADNTVRTLKGTGTVSISGMTATVALAAPVLHGETVTLAYVKPRTNRLQDEIRINTASFTGEAVTNETLARPQTSGGGLISNMGQSAPGSLELNSLYPGRAQSFTTGLNPHGYSLTGVDAKECLINRSRSFPVQMI